MDEFFIVNPADRGVEEELLREEGSQPGIRPQMFKNLIGKGHPEFSTNKQQDAQEFFLHLVTQIGKGLNSGCGSGFNVVPGFYNYKYFTSSKQKLRVLFFQKCSNPILKATHRGD